MTDKHLSTQFDAELSGISTRVLEMGGLVESQVAQAVEALGSFSGDIASHVLKQRRARQHDGRSRSTATCSTIIARRQPTARDLRLLIAVSKTIANLERVGDEAARIARTVQRLINTGVSSRLRLPMSDLSYEAELATAQLRKALDAFARLDVDRALEVLKADDQIDKEFDGLMRKLITYMMEDPRTISSSHRPGVRRQGDRARGRSRQEPGRSHHLRGQGHRRPPQLAGRRREHGALSTDKRSPVRPPPRARRRDPQEELPRMSRILVVEDESAIAELISINLRHAGYEVTLAGNAEQAQPGSGPRAARSGRARLDAAGPDRPGAGASVARRHPHPRTCPSSC